ncbi:MAG: hypothetical protein JOZ78_02310 [Chroococcidiopsidaceae cyanobacterium CP_BM_ER_R8_30]|nr:hypothetical protein [Chroococcidiopsidaceae cyanobacterium CP_BM_ER_R8_30]
MSVFLGQLVYTSFPEVGLKVLTSAQVPVEIQQVFMQQIVHQYWDSYHPPSPGYRAAYIYQVNPVQSLFGWLYNDEKDDLGRQHVPYFICYYFASPILDFQLENIFTCLLRGPIALIDRHRLPNTLETIAAPNLWTYQPDRLGVEIPFSVREHSHTALKQKQLLDLFISVGDEPITQLSSKKSFEISSANGNRPILISVKTIFHLLLGVGIGIALIAGIGALYANSQLTQIRTLKAQTKYKECITQAELKSWAAEITLHNDTQRLLNECRLGYSKTLARRGKLEAAIEVVGKIPDTSPLYPEAQKLLKAWLEI